MFACFFPSKSTEQGLNGWTGKLAVPFRMAGTEITAFTTRVVCLFGLLKDTLILKYVDRSKRSTGRCVCLLRFASPLGFVGKISRPVDMLWELKQAREDLLATQQRRAECMACVPDVLDEEERDPVAPTSVRGRGQGGAGQAPINQKQIHKRRFDEFNEQQGTNFVTMSQVKRGKANKAKWGAMNFSI